MLNEKEHVFFVVSSFFEEIPLHYFIIDDNSIVKDETNCAHLGW